MSNTQTNHHGYWLDCDFISGACFSYENSIRHFKYSDTAAVEKDFGFAISHTILGVEELIKSLLLICCEADSGFLTSAEKDMVFARHDFKHLNIKELFTSLSPELLYQYHENPFAFLDSGQGNRFQTTAHFLSKGLGLGHLEEDEIDSLLDLMSKANDYKNKGFYVDYRTDWKTPEDINAATYSQYKILSDKLLAYINPIFTTSVTDDRIQHFLQGNWI